MHEGNYTSRIVQAVLGELGRYPDKKPKRVHVLVGEMLHLQEESVKMHFELLTQGTPLEGVELDLKEISVKIKCSACGKELEISDHHDLHCPACGSTDTEVTGGNEVFIESIDLA